MPTRRRGSDVSWLTGSAPHPEAIGVSSGSGSMPIERFSSNSLPHNPRSARGDSIFKTLAMTGVGEGNRYDVALDSEDEDDETLTIGITSEESWTLEEHFPTRTGIQYVVEAHTTSLSNRGVTTNLSESDTFKMSLTISRRNAVTLIDDIQDELITLVALKDKDLLLRKTLIKLLVRLTHRFNWIPSSLLVHDVTSVSPDPIYAGGFADIFKASHRGQEVALKRFREFLPGHDSNALDKRFHREIFMWKALSHKHVLPFLGVDKDTFPSRLCMVSPWMKNCNLLSYIGTNRCSSRKINELLFHAARGLEYLHSQRVVHGDMRCVNILVNDRDEAVLADFGLASLSAGMANTITITEGSARWNAPELLMGDRVIRSHESDIYSFGCVCLEAYTGRAPFADIASGFAVIARVVAGDKPTRPFRPSPQGNLISDGLWSLMIMCWDRSPQERPNAQELSYQLGQICSHGRSRSATAY
ncbi:kinase-like protein [Punctularia strigosozonata HHB-11173 SS5]|uniref:kinase-like protein n=1 Tax=Punctularia strigosozonata (strain HHB-11173) TaxID=741275 RepID=UPI00044164B2|nr:kinase-like protein [Punctularia strigosozonata HHB-11173 SS5]EIN08913.1 kinase-like protein [Punctularia strigosozonata HHB-11173 SS5]